MTIKGFVKAVGGTLETNIKPKDGILGRYEVQTAIALVVIEYGYSDGRPLVFINPYDGSGIITKEALSLNDAYDWLYAQLV